MLGGLLGGQGQVTPQQASQVPPDAVQQLAAHAERANPSIVDAVSGFYSQHPDLVRSLGAGALALMMGAMARHGGQGQGGPNVLPASQDPSGDPAQQGGLPPEVLPAPRTRPAIPPTRGEACRPASCPLLKTPTAIPPTRSGGDPGPDGQTGGSHALR